MSEDSSESDPEASGAAKAPKPARDPAATTTWVRPRRPKSSATREMSARELAARAVEARRPSILRRRLPFMGRLDRYVLNHFVQSYLTAMLLMTGLFMVIDMASNLDNYLEPWPDGTTVPASILLRFYILNLPYLFLQVAPFVTLIAGMFTVSKLLKAREVTAVLSAGVSARRMLLPVFFSGLMLALGMFALREFVGMGVASERDSLRDVLEEKRLEPEYENLAVIEESGSVVILDRFYPKPVDGSPPRVEGLVAILRTDADYGVAKYNRIDAETAVYEDRHWNLTGGRRTRIDPEDQSNLRRQDKVNTLDGYEFTPELAMTFKRAKDAPLELTFSEVQSLMERDPADTSYQTLWHYHLTFPLANVILLLVGIPLMFTYERGRGSERMAIGGLLCIFYYAADFVFRTLGIKGQLSPLLSAWIPVLIFGAIGVMLYDSLKS
ncbi:putative permease YjgP/YjgQ family protein [Planctomycetes bacterium Poly30]|uniref:Putative permease YjgP/YjgQ family protein n=1 Tax=Saltatorellus ferox TaxID=2528018 RepID=A0A518EQ67_9BACT|nr:putative permease YjgP/YjgQ family protein [Planctomycetes bacterium Poly30]